MQIGVANAAVQDVDENVLRAKTASLKIKRSERRSSAPRGVTFNSDHDRSSLRRPMTASKYFASRLF
jgi:hypothetical protein